MKTKPNHCRLSIILATDVPKGVIFRRGPSLWTQVILWDTSTDTFTEGQWFKGKIYTDRCDLSPDGSKLLYFAAKHYKRYDSTASYAPTWTAISKPPYLTALVLWNDGGTWGNGGHFEDNQTICVPSVGSPHPDHLLPAWLQINPDSCEKTDNHAWWRLRQNGWKAISEMPRFFKWPHDFSSDPPTVPTVYEKDSPDHQFKLRMSHSYGSYTINKYGTSAIISYSIRRGQEKKEQLISDTWADWDHNKRFAYANKGQLFIGRLGTDGITTQILADFNPNRPKLVKAPEWAKHW